MPTRFSDLHWSSRCHDLTRPGRTALVLALLASMLVLAMPFSSAGAQATVTPSPTATSPGDVAYPPPVPTDPNYTQTPNAYPGAEGSQTPLVPPTVGPSPTAGLAATVTPAFPTPVFPTLTPNLTLAVPVITTASGLTTTATLIPLPALTLVFPQQRAAAELVTATPDPSQPPPPWTQPQRLVPLALIGMIWVILAGWFFYSQREL